VVWLNAKDRLSRISKSVKHITGVMEQIAETSSNEMGDTSNSLLYSLINSRH